MYVVQTAQSSWDLSNINADEEQAWSDKMNKEQSADDPSVDLIRVKNMLEGTISELPLL